MIVKSASILSLTDTEIDLVSGGEGEVRQAAENAGVEFINAVEDAVEYIHGFFVGIGRGISNGK